ncbi:lactococcin G-beta/enterocin 1071B family bacteriocin [Thermoanaerobacter sp. A7A]|uniref:lactococcin G-beta/enterocin 1071B family bacteriocin n=1 Tax=Thermoanaerobacter sp. A7A TaxID=1350366 RepID=UPI00041C491C|nr:lactococcin G-beta/enterocin 1071B family bacteriocin [Thermoanaerobacter sp. A7A]
MEANLSMLCLNEDELQEINGGSPWEAVGKFTQILSVLDAAYNFGKGFVDGFKAAFDRDR